MEILQKAKILLNLGSDSHPDDAALEIFIGSAKNKALNYCNRDDLTPAIESVVLDVAMHSFNEWQNNRNNGNTGDVNSIKRGDTEITYAKENYNNITGAGGADFSKNHIKQLNTSKKLKR